VTVESGRAPARGKIVSDPKKRLPVGAIVQIVVSGKVFGYDHLSVELENGSLIDPDDIVSATILDDSEVPS
jgi:hypothetical protein